MLDPTILRERSKVKLVADQELERQMPSRQAIVEITLTDGRHLRQFVGAVRGTSDNPMTRQEIVDKCRDLIIPVVGAKRCASLVDRVFALENVKDIRELRPLLQAN
jgi:2-methylcitrate dehydratase PrpD